MHKASHGCPILLFWIYSIAEFICLIFHHSAETGQTKVRLSWKRWPVGIVLVGLNGYHPVGNSVTSVREALIKSVRPEPVEGWVV